MMKHFILFILLLFVSLSGVSQEVRLGEVRVRGSRVVQKQNGQWIFPTATELKNSPDGYSLLSKLALPGLRIDVPSRSISAIDNRGDVSIRINDIPATKQDLLSLDMSAVMRVEYIDRPGLRYGEDVAYVINFVVHRPTSGYSLGTDFFQNLTCQSTDGNIFTRFNSGKSEWGLDYNLSSSDLRGSRYQQQTEYQLSDGSVKTISRNDLDNLNRSLGNIAQFTYNLSDTSYVLQSRFTLQTDLHPSFYCRNRLITDQTSYIASMQERNRRISPALDVYFHRDFRRHQQLTISATGTHIFSKGNSSYDEGQPFSYHVRGRVWSLLSEGIYENHLKPFVLSAGLKYNQKFTNNLYSGDASSHSIFRSSEQYAFSQVMGKWKHWQYTMGLGFSHRYYRQSYNNHHFWVFRPRFNVGYDFGHGFQLSYDFQRGQHTSHIALVNDVTLRINSMELLVGNPALKPNSVTEHTLRFNYNRSRLSARLQGYAKLNSKTNLHRYIRTPENIFIDTQENQPHCNLLMTQGYLRYDFIPDHLNAALVSTFAHFDNKGNDYRHFYNSFQETMMVNAYFGHWTLRAYADTGWRWMEGEGKGRNGMELQFSLMRQINNVSLTAFVRNPFRAHPVIHRSEGVNRYLHPVSRLSDADQGNNIGFNLTWKFSHGRTYRHINRTINLQDKDAGILK